MLSRRSKRLVLGWSAILLVSAVVLFSVTRYFENQELKRRYEEERAQIKPRPLNAVAVESRVLGRTQRYAAVVEPWHEAKVAAEVMGRAVKVTAEPGDSVRAGDLLVELDSSLAAAALKSAEAGLVNAQVQLEEAERLREEAARLAKQSAISGTEEKAADARVRMAAADVNRYAAERDRLKEALQRYAICAPFDGTVRERKISPGDMVDPDQEVATVVALDPLRVVFYVSELDIPRFEKGKSAEVELPSFPGQTFGAVIEHVSRSADPATRLFRVEASLPNSQHKLPGGLHGLIACQQEQSKESLLVPVNAVRLLGRKAAVEKVLGEDRVELVEISIGPELDGYYPVLAGLDAGDKVVVR